MAVKKISQTPKTQSLRKMQKNLKVQQMKKKFGDVKNLADYKKHVFKG